MKSIGFGPARDVHEGSNMTNDSVSGYDLTLQKMRSRADYADEIAARGEGYEVASAARRELPRLAADIRALIAEIEALRGGK